MSAADWTEEREAKLKTLWTQGLSCSQIARLLGGVTRNAVIGKRIRLGLPNRAQPNRTYGVPKRQRSTAPRAPHKIAAAISAPKYCEPTFKAIPTRTHAPMRGPNSIRFIDASPAQCQMFCEGEEMASGFVCGGPVSVNRWCAACANLVFQPSIKAKAAA